MQINFPAPYRKVQNKDGNSFMNTQCNICFALLSTTVGTCLNC